MPKRPRIPDALNDGEVVTPRPAASVLICDARSPWRLLMMRRPDTTSFAAGVWVFPGGGVHEPDESLPDPFRAAAVREVFEEVGVLLARGPGGAPATSADADRVRAAVHGGAAFWDVIREARLQPALDELAFCGRWITPRRVRRRYDTRFYVIRLPPGQGVHAEPGEVVEWRWLTPAEALADEAMEMIHVTRRILQQVLPHADPAALHAELAARAETPPITPRVRRLPDGTVEVVDEVGE
jgi:8-oxo-dGTP pyrophosphatase MutT (NUDIX family)